MLVSRNVEVVHGQSKGGNRCAKETKLVSNYTDQWWLTSCCCSSEVVDTLHTGHVHSITLQTGDVHSKVSPTKLRKSFSF